MRTYRETDGQIIWNVSLPGRPKDRINTPCITELRKLSVNGGSVGRISDD
jgi:hypothetical protein